MKRTTVPVLAASLLAGCAATTTLPVPAPDPALASQLPLEAAREWLRQLPLSGYDANMRCQYREDSSINGQPASAWEWDATTRTSGNWVSGHIDLMIYQAKAPIKSFSLVSRSCLVYQRDLPATPANTALIQQEMQKTLAALAALGARAYE